MLRRCYIVLAILCCLAALSANAEWTALQNYPHSGGQYAATAAAAIADGRMVVWDAGTLYLQAAVNCDVWNPIATGYEGDPWGWGFVSIAPDGHTAFLGGADNPVGYLVDTNDPVDYVEGSAFTLPTHFSGAFLNDHLIVLDRGKDDWSGSELVVVDLASKSSDYAAHTVLSTPPDKALVLDKPAWSYAALVYVDHRCGCLYAMDANTCELRVFPVSSLINAFLNGTELDWTNDGSPIGSPGDFFSRGVSGITRDRCLVIGGSAGLGLAGGVQLVDIGSAQVTNTLDPAGSGGFYFPIYNPRTDDILAFVDGVAWVSEPWSTTVPTPFGCCVLAPAPAAGKSSSNADAASAGIVAATLIFGSWLRMRRK